MAGTAIGGDEVFQSVSNMGFWLIIGMIVSVRDVSISLDYVRGEFAFAPGANIISASQTLVPLAKGLRGRQVYWLLYVLTMAYLSGLTDMLVDTVLTGG